MNPSSNHGSAARQYDGFNYPGSSSTFVHHDLNPTAGSDVPAQSPSMPFYNAENGIGANSTSFPRPPAPVSGLVKRTPHGSGGSPAQANAYPAYGYFHQHTSSAGGHSAFGSDAGSSISNTRRQQQQQQQQQQQVHLQASPVSIRDSVSDVVSAPLPLYQQQHQHTNSTISSRGPSHLFQQTDYSGGTGGGVSRSSGRDRNGVVSGVLPAPSTVPFLPGSGTGMGNISTGSNMAPPIFTLSAGSSMNIPYPITDSSGRTGVMLGDNQHNSFSPMQQQQQQQLGGDGKAARQGGFFSKMMGNVFQSLRDDEGSDGTGRESTNSPRPVYQTRFGYPEDDLPLLEELGISPRHMIAKAMAVLNPFSTAATEVMEDTDLTGPVVLVVALGFLLSLRRREMQFSAIYGLCVLGVLFFKVLLSLMHENGVPLQFVMSSLGYSLLPSLLFTLLCTVTHITHVVVPAAMAVVAWSSWCATALITKGMSMEKQRYLILYPMVLFYAVFAVLTLF